MRTIWTLVFTCTLAACPGESDDDTGPADTTAGETTDPTDADPTAGSGDGHCAAYCGKFDECFGADPEDDTCISDCTTTIEVALRPECLPQWMEYIDCVVALECAEFENPGGSSCAPQLAAWNNEACVQAE